MQFFFEVLIGGLLSGVMYALVALGFVLIYKASGVFNFAQGAMVFFAALTAVGLQELGMPLWVAIILTMAVMVVRLKTLQVRYVLIHQAFYKPRAYSELMGHIAQWPELTSNGRYRDWTGGDTQIFELRK